MSTLDTSREGRLRLDRSDLAVMPDDGRRYELIDGAIAGSPSPIPRHQRASKRLQFALESYLRQTRAGVLYNAPLDVVLTDHDVVEPDLFVILRGGKAIIGETAVEGAPDLVIEILSPSTEKRDRRVKRQLYAQHGVREYWLVDVDAERVERFEPHQDQLELRELVEAPGELRSSILPGFALSLEELFAPEEL